MYLQEKGQLGLISLSGLAWQLGVVGIVYSSLGEEFDSLFSLIYSSKYIFVVFSSSTSIVSANRRLECGIGVPDVTQDLPHSTSPPPGHKLQVRLVFGCWACGGSRSMVLFLVSHDFFYSVRRTRLFNIIYQFFPKRLTYLKTQMRPWFHFFFQSGSRCGS